MKNSELLGSDPEPASSGRAGRGEACGAAVELRGVSHAYRQGGQGVPVLDRVDARFAPGEFVVVLGRSGSGKTTLLNLLAGLDVPAGGDVVVAGEVVSALDEAARAGLRRRLVGMVFQAYNLVPTLTAWENVALPLTLRGTGLDAARDAAHAMLERVGLDGLGHRFPSALSGGEQQRVAVARAVVARPPLLLADEPTGSLDIDNARAVVVLLESVAREHAITLVMATHSLEVAGHADRRLRLGGGRLVAEDATP